MVYTYFEVELQDRVPKLDAVACEARVKDQTS